MVPFIFMNSNSYLKIGRVNIHFLNPSIDEVKLLPFKYRFDISGILESWLSQRTDLELFKIDSYNLFKLGRAYVWYLFLMLFWMKNHLMMRN